MGRGDKVTRLSKNQKRRQKAKEGKQSVRVKINGEDTASNNINVKKIISKNDVSEAIRPEIQSIDIVVESLEEEGKDYEEFRSIISKFTVESPTEDKINEVGEHDTTRSKHEGTLQKSTDSVKNGPEHVSQSQEPETLSKRKFMELHNIPLSDLKSITAPYNHSINWQDTNAPDAYLHVYLKTMHNSVPIPRHWVSKKGFLSSKRGERRLFELPSFIKATGIAEMRGTDTEGNEDTLKQRMRARVQPKSGQLDLNFNVLHDAFFKHQLKPPLLKYGELYYEGMDNNTNQINERVKSRYKPGKLSIELQKALGIQNGANPPWLENMIKLGSPPEYPNMKISERGITYGTANRVNKTQNWGILADDLDSDTENDDRTAKTNGKEKDDNDVDEVYKAQEGDLLLGSYGDDALKPAKMSANKQDQDSAISDGKLYHVLHKKKFDGKDSIYGDGTLAYDVKDPKKRLRNDNRGKNVTHEHNPSEGKPKKFRF